MKRMLYVTGLLLCTSLGGYAQEGNLIDVKVVNEEVKKQGSEVSLRMTLDLTGLRVGNQKSVCLHPAVVSADGTHEAVLAPVVVDGKTRSRVHRREKALTGASPATDNAYTVLRSGRESRVEYIAKLAYGLDGGQPPSAARADDGLPGLHGGHGRIDGKGTFHKAFHPAVCHAFRYTGA